MAFILQIYKKLCNLFVRGKNKKNIEKEEDLVSIISVDIDKNNERVLSIYLPENLQTNDVIDVAEIYAKAIIDMSNGQLAKETVAALRSNLDPNNHQQKLFIDNVVYSWSYMSAFEKQSAALAEGEPVVKPSKVFKNQ
jgi:hypothetical protein